MECNHEHIFGDDSLRIRGGMRQYLLEEVIGDERIGSCFVFAFAFSIDFCLAITELTDFLGISFLSSQCIFSLDEVAVFLKFA